MSRLASAFKINDSIRTKEFMLGGFPFRVRIPLDKELEAITQRFVSPSEEAIQARMDKMTALLKGEELESAGVTKESVISVLQMEQKITEYFKLLIPVEGDISDLTYDEISEEFPLQVQIELLSKITEVIQPGYRDARKN